MSTQSDVSAKIAEETLKAMAGQIDSVNALSLAVVGGIFAFSLQIILHNRNSSANKVVLAGTPTLYIALVAQALSMLLGMLAKGSLTSSIPALLQFDFSKVATLGEATFKNATQTTTLAACQGYAFLLGVAVLAAFLIFNRKLLKA